jgi:hypothetical protein
MTGRACSKLKPASTTPPSGFVPFCRRILHVPVGTVRPRSVHQIEALCARNLSGAGPNPSSDPRGASSAPDAAARADLHRAGIVGDWRSEGRRGD